MIDGVRVSRKMQKEVKMKKEVEIVKIAIAVRKIKIWLVINNHLAIEAAKTLLRYPKSDSIDLRRNILVRIPLI